MKKTLLFVSALCMGTSAAFAQLDTIPNANFEYWTDGVSQEPNNWGTLNGKSFTVTLPPPINTVTVNVPQTSVIRARGVDSLGAGTIQINTSNQAGNGIPGIAVSNVAKADIAFGGTPPKPSFSGGFPFRQRAAALTGYCKYVPGAGAGGAESKDSALIGVALTKWNTLTSQRDTIGTASLILTDTMDWHHFAANITYRGGAVAPDSAIIVLISSATQTRANSRPGTKLLIDSLEFDYGCTLDPAIISSGKMPQQLPPSTDTLKLNAGQAYTSTITFFVPDSVDIGTGTPLKLDSVRISQADIAITGLGTTTSYTIASNWPGGVFGTNTIACVTISGTVPATPVNGKGTVVVTPWIYLSGDATGIASPQSSTTQVKIGNGSTIGIEDFSLSGGLTVNQNIPNPFDGTTTINFNTSVGGTIDFIVTDVLGRQVYDTNINATVGGNTFVFTTDLANGTYFFSLSDGTNTVTKKMVITE